MGNSKFFLGNINIKGLKLGNSDVKAYLGDTLLYPLSETRLVAKFNVTDTSNPTRIASGTSNFSSIEIDGVEQGSLTTGYTFSTTGEHTVRYKLRDITRIGDYAFYGCTKLTSVTIQDSVTSIGNEAFYGCTLTSVTIPDSVTSIGNGVFRYCTSLTSINIPDSVTSIGSSAFDNTPWWRAYSADASHHYGNIIYINDVAYHATSNSIASVTFKVNTVGIGGGAFYNCSGLTSIDIPSGVTSIGNEAFYYCSGLTSIVSNATTAPIIRSYTFRNVKSGGTLTVPIGSSGYDVWMGTGNYYLGHYNWTKVEQ